MWPHKQEDLSLVPRTHIKKQVPAIPVLGRVETGRSLGLAGLIGEVPDNVKPCLKESG